MKPQDEKNQNRVEAGRKAAVTRRANATKAKRSKAAKEGWVTRRLSGNLG